MKYPAFAEKAPKEAARTVPLSRPLAAPGGDVPPRTHRGWVGIDDIFPPGGRNFYSRPLSKWVRHVAGIPRTDKGQVPHGQLPLNPVRAGRQQR